MSYRWWSSFRTNVGRRRQVNEDAFLAVDEQGLWVVADGMGGHALGDVASRIVVESFKGLKRPATMDEYAAEIKTRLWQANLRMREEILASNKDEVMGATVVAFMVHKNEWMCLWAGDSRAYLLRDGRLTRLTRDHSLVQEMVNRGELLPEEAEHHPLSNRITRAIGVEQELHLDERRSFLRDGDAVLLCSDGLNKEVNDREIETVLDSHDCDLASLELLDLSLERGARDNVTVAVIRFEATTGFGDRQPDETDLDYDNNEKPVESLGRRPEVYPTIVRGSPAERG